MWTSRFFMLTAISIFILVNLNLALALDAVVDIFLPKKIRRVMI